MSSYPLPNNYLFQSDSLTPKQNHQSDRSSADPVRQRPVSSSQVPAIVLHAGRTDLATARCLADQGIPVYATIVSDADIARYSNSLTGSPMTMRRSPELIAFVCDRLVVQSRIDGGDNHIFDCYGLCNRNGGLVTCASAKTRRTEASPAMVRYHHAV